MSSASPLAPPDPRRWKALAFVGLAQLMVVLDGTIVNIALPSAQHDLGFSDGQRQWVVTAYALPFGALLLFGGRLADRVGRKRAFQVGVIGFALASALGGASVDTWMLFGARALQGCFGALLAPSALSLVTVMFTEARERAKAFGIWGSIAGGGAAVGLMLGGLLTQYLSWRWTLLVNVFFAITAAAGATITVREPARPRHHARLDFVGIVLVTGGLGSLVYGLSRAESDGWSARPTVSLLIGAGAALVLFVIVEAVSKAPLLPLRVVWNRDRGGAYLALGLAIVGIFGAFLFLTYYLQSVLGMSPLRSGAAFLPMVGGMLVGATQISARLMTRVRPRFLMPPGFLLGAAGMVAMTRITPSTPYHSWVLPGTIALGLGMGCAFMPAMNVATGGVDPRDAGVASAMVNTSQQVGGAVGTALLSTLALSSTRRYTTAHTDASQTQAMVHGFVTAFWCAAGLLTAASVVAFVFISFRVKAPAGEHQPYQDDRVLVHGRVRDRDGTPMTPAVITAVAPQGQQVGRSHSAEDGAYRLVLPHQGTFLLIVSADGREPEATTVTVREHTVDHDIVLSERGRLCATVRSADGAPLPGATLMLTDAAGELITSRRTGEDGTHSFRDLPLGRLTLAVSAPGHRPAALTVTVDGRTTARAAVHLTPAARLTGTVRAWSTDSPLHDARVMLMDGAGNVVATVDSDPQGGYAFADLAAGEYTLIASGYPPVATAVRVDDRADSRHDVQLGHPER
ncbi:MAG: DHA2 family efflux MFS transporter permease subunit [Catenulispora sp.]|nr:DHA2 family efflux MFS transporter permease subunit [Catenulispora sp.]